MFFKRPDIKWEDFNPEEDYTGTQLDMFATALLRKDRKEHKAANDGKEPPVTILFEEQLYNRSKREICVNALEIDETLTNSMADTDKPGVTKGDGQRIYQRAHPKGRGLNTDEARKRGASYFKNLMIEPSEYHLSHFYYDDPLSGVEPIT